MATSLIPLRQQRRLVTYYTGSGSVYTAKVRQGKDCLADLEFSTALSGWTLIGWREDTTASGTVLTKKTVEKEAVTLYAVYSQTITLTYNGNSATSGSVSKQTGTRYYNAADNYLNPSFTLVSSGYTKTNYTLGGWTSGSTSGTYYTKGASVTLSASATFYAYWVLTVTSFAYTGGMQSYTVPVSGLYLLEANGAGGGYYTGNTGAIAYGGYTKYYASLTKGTIVYICVGQRGAEMTDLDEDEGDVTSGTRYNGGGSGVSGNASRGALTCSGGGATHFATASGTLASLGSSNKSKIYCVAGGGGGMGVYNGNYPGGAGGGTSGGAGTTYMYSAGSGGTQSSGGSAGYAGESAGSFGLGGTSGGGGGLYGGGGAGYANGAGGGSGYIKASTTTYNSTSYTNSTTAGGGNSGNGSATVTLIAA